MTISFNMYRETMMTQYKEQYNRASYSERESEGDETADRQKSELA